jgi:predicted small secreted protein
MVPSTMSALVAIALSATAATATCVTPNTFAGPGRDVSFGMYSRCSTVKNTQN